MNVPEKRLVSLAACSASRRIRFCEIRKHNQMNNNRTDPIARRCALPQSTHGAAAACTPPGCRTFFNFIQHSNLSRSASRLSRDYVRSNDRFNVTPSSDDQMLSNTRASNVSYPKSCTPTTLELQLRKYHMHRSRDT